MRRKQELKLDLGPDSVLLFSLNSLRFSLTSETDKKKKLFNFSKLQFLNDEICHLLSNLAKLMIRSVNLTFFKVEKILKGSLVSISTPSVKFKLWVEKFA